MKFFKNTYLIILLILFATVSCVKQNTVDFNQANDITLNQQAKIGFVNFKMDTSVVKGVNLLPMGSLPPYLIDPFDVFNNTVFQQYLDSIKIHFEIENTYDRDFEVKTNFLDINDNIRYSIILDAPRNTRSQSETLKDITVYKADILNLIFTTKANIKIKMLNNPTTNKDARSHLTIKSGATLFFTY